MITETTTTIEQYALTIKKAIKERIGLLTSVGVACTKSAAKIASDFQKPDGLTIIYPDQLQKFFEHLGVERISGIGPKTQQILKEMGTETIGQLAKHDVQKLIEKFGKKNGIWMWRVANGRDDEPVMPREDHISLSTEQTLDSFTRNKETILKYLNQLGRRRWRGRPCQRPGRRWCGASPRRPTGRSLRRSGGAAPCRACP